MKVKSVRRLFLSPGFDDHPGLLQGGFAVLPSRDKGRPP